MALEVALAGGDINKYNPYSTFLEYTGAASLWSSIVANQIQPVCPTGVTQGTDIEIVRGHLDKYLAYALSKRPELAAYNQDPDFFAFPNRIFPPDHPRYNFVTSYGSTVMVLYLLARADDETDLPRAGCYLTAAVDIGKTLMRLMQADGYNPALATPQLRLGTFQGLYRHYPAWADGGPGFGPYGGQGDLGVAGCEWNPEVEICAINHKCELVFALISSVCYVRSGSGDH